MALDDWNKLEAMLDAKGLAVVLSIISNICKTKVGAIKREHGPEYLAIAWSDHGDDIRALAKKIKDRDDA